MHKICHFFTKFFSQGVDFLRMTLTIKSITREVVAVQN